MTLRRIASLALAVLLGVGTSALADDTSIFKDWKEVQKNSSRDFSKERAAFWEKKGIEPKDRIWLGLMWQRGGDFEKAQAILEEFAKAADMNPKNRERAMLELMNVARDKNDWAAVVTRAEAMRKEFPDTEHKTTSWVEQGRAHRLAGDKDKAISAFTNAAELKWMAGIIDLMDLHLCDGEVDAARKVGEQYLADEQIKEGAKEQTLKPLVEFLDLVGKKAPALEGVQQVGKGAEVTTLEGKPTVFYYWNIPMGGQDYGFRMIRNLERAFGDAIQVAAISTYNKYDPVTKKIVDTLSEEDEIKGYKIYLEQAPAGAPPAVVVPVAVRDGLWQRFNTQKTVIDAEGKFRYVRIPPDMPGIGPYNWKCVELALKKILGS